MKQQLEHLIDASLAQLNSGMDLEAILALHPDAADELRPILAAAAWVQLDIPGPSRRLEGKQALLNAVVQRRREVELTQGFVNELKAGVPLDDLLRHAAPAMRPLLVAAWRMQTTEVPGPDPERFAEGKQLIMALAARRQTAARPRGLTIRLPRGVSNLVSGLGWRTRVAQRAWSGAVAAVAVAIVGAAGVTTAAADSLPGDAFYKVKRLGESAQLWFAFDPVQRAALDTRFTANRQAEIERLIAQDRSISPGVLQAWLGGQSDVLGELHQLPHASQVRLGETLRAWQTEGVATLESLIADAATAEALRTWLDRIAPERAIIVTPAAVDTLGDASLNAPMPVERPLPPEDRARAMETRSASGPLPAAVPVAPPSVAPSGPVVSDQPPLPEDVFLQSGSGSSNGDDPDDRSADGSGTSGAPAQATATEEIPDTIQVPMGPTAVPTSGSGGSADPGTLPPNPATPEPPTSPAPGTP